MHVHTARLNMPEEI